MRFRCGLTAAAGIGCLLALGAFAATGSSALRDTGTTTELTTTTEASTSTAVPTTTAATAASTSTAVPTTTRLATTSSAPTPATTTPPAAPRVGLPPDALVVSGSFPAIEIAPPVSVPHDVSGKFNWAGGLRSPLAATPALLGGPYVFPVAGAVAWGDTFGGPRGDVPGGWHHGDDVFARLGQPVLAVADGRVYSIGWEHLGGWRLWLRDREGNRFYYAHLSGYTRVGELGGVVHAGDVLGFIGHTGDAFTTLAHLHFEIHPAQFLALRYDGAVNPSSYLSGWRHVEHPRVPPPAPLPSGAAAYGEGAVSDYRRLLALRARPTAPLPTLPGFRRRLPPDPVGIAAPAQLPGSHWRLAFSTAAIALLGLGAVVVRRR
jgi:murein DD-endopeptidase MepM/ murein hydrolase activator NlpD